MKINLVYPNDGWILDVFGQELAKRIECKVTNILPDLGNDYDIVYYINHAIYKPHPRAKLVGAYFTHRENVQFDKIANQVDFVICMSQRYSISLAQTFTDKKIFTVNAGVDLDFFKPKIRLGIAAKFGNVRKGMEWLPRIRELPYVDIKCADGKTSRRDMANFYNSIDYLLVLSKIEGGPMPVLEALACGKTVITSDVGFINHEIRRGIHVYDRDNFESLQHVLEGLYWEREAISDIVKNMTWQNYAAQHASIFNQLIVELKNE